MYMSLFKLNDTHVCLFVLGFRQLSTEVGNEISITVDNRQQKWEMRSQLQLTIVNGSGK